MFPTQTQIDPSLAALLQTAQMVTPDQTPTVAAQVAQAAAQKLMPAAAPPGISALMPGVKQQAMNTAQAAQPVTQAQVQQMMQAQMNQQGQGAPGARSPGPGVAGIPAQNMQRMQQMAEGGVVGFATGDAVPLPEQPQAPDYEEIRKREDERYTAAPTINRIRGIEAQRVAAEKALPDLSAAGIAALQRKRQADEELMAGVRADDPRRRRAAMFEEWGGAKGVYNKQLDTINQRESLANQAALQHEQAVLTLQKAQQERELGRFDRALALEKQAADMEDKARDASLRAQQISAGIASNIYSSQATMRGQDIQAQEAAANRANSIELERMRRATVDRPGETERIFNRFNELKAKDPAAAEQYLQSIERIKGLGRPTDRAVLTYAQAAKIVDERLSELGTQFALNKEEADAAKRENRTPRTLAQMREDLIRKEMSMAGGLAGSAAPSGGPAPAPGASAAPAVGTIMQGYRFKGGNPADKNNWEKV